MRWRRFPTPPTRRLLGRRVGGSTGTNFVGVLRVAQAMRARGESGSIVTILCDGGERYAHSYYNADWYAAEGIEVEQADRAIAAAAGGSDALPDLQVLSLHAGG
jgi:cysteine synthase